MKVGAGWAEGGVGQFGANLGPFFFLENIIYFFLVSSRSVVTLPLGKLKAGAAWWRGSGLGGCEVSRGCYFLLFFCICIFTCLCICVCI